MSKAIAFGKHVIAAGARKTIPAADWNVAAAHHAAAGSLKILNPGRDPLVVLNTNRGAKMVFTPAHTAVSEAEAPPKKRKTSKG